MKLGKVAICISGLTRTGIEAYPCFKHFFRSIENYDVFYHTWQTNTEKEEQIKKLYNPVACLIEPPRDKLAEGSFGSALYSMMMANELKKKHEIEKW